MATGINNLPFPGKVYNPMDILTAEELNEDVSNVESLATGSGIGDGAVTAEKLTDGVAWKVLATKTVTNGAELKVNFTATKYIKVMAKVTPRASSPSTVTIKFDDARTYDYVVGNFSTSYSGGESPTNAFFAGGGGQQNAEMMIWADIDNSFGKPVISSRTYRSGSSRLYGATANTASDITGIVISAASGNIDGEITILGR